MVEAPLEEREPTRMKACATVLTLPRLPFTTSAGAAVRPRRIGDRPLVKEHRGCSPVPRGVRPPRRYADRRTPAPAGRPRPPKSRRSSPRCDPHPCRDNHYVTRLYLYRLPLWAAKGDASPTA